MTDQAAPLAPRPKRRWLRRILKVVFVLVVLYAAYRYTLHCMVEAKLDEIRKQGYPVTLAELDKWYPQVPAGENAAIVYLEAFKLFAPKQAGDTNLPVVGDAKLPPRGQPMSEETKAAVAEYLKKNQQALALVHQGAKLTRCRYPLHFTQGWGTPLPHLSKIKQGVRVLSLEAIMYAERGEAAEAARSIFSSLALARSLSTEPTTISQLTRLTCYRIAATGLEAVLNRVSLPDDSLRELGAGFAELNASNALVLGYAGEPCFVIDFYKQPVERILSMSDNLPPRPRPKAKVLFLRVTGRLDIFLLHDLDAMEGFLRIWRLPFPEGVKHTKDADPRSLFVRLLLFLPNGTYGMASQAGHDTIVQRAARNSAQVTASIASLATERYRLANGKLPDKLNELVPAFLPAVPTDPFDGQPLRYKKLANGYVVYSVDKDGKDDGGDEKKDITFTVER